MTNEQPCEIISNPLSTLSLLTVAGLRLDPSDKRLPSEVITAADSHYLFKAQVLFLPKQT